MTRQKQVPEHVLAAYVVFEGFYNHDIKSSRDILARFLRYVLLQKKVRDFTLTDLETWLSDEFGFQIPEAVVESALNALRRQIPIERANDVYHIQGTLEDFVDPAEEQKIQQETEATQDVLDLLEKHLAQKGRVAYRRAQIVEELNRFLMDEESGDAELSLQINSFIWNLKNKSEQWYQQIASMRTGCILLHGISYDLDHVKMHDGKLTLFLATEILFDIEDLNEIVRKHVADDFMQLVHEYNRPERRIILRYFTSTKEEVHSFFFKAEHLLRQGATGTAFGSAMKKILEGCEKPSDVVEKEERFWGDLHRLGIDEDSFDYYTKELEPYNLEMVQEDPEDEKPVRYLSNINKLRRGKQAEDYIAAGALLLTTSSRALRREENQPGKRNVPLAVHIGTFTQYLWFRLRKGYDVKMGPQWFDAGIKAKILLSEAIQHNINAVYEEAKKKFEAGEMKMEEIQQIILTLRKYDVSPEQLTEEHADAMIHLDEATVRRSIEEQQQKEQALARAREELEEEKQKRRESEAERDALVAEKKQQAVRERMQAQQKEEQRKRMRQKIWFWAKKAGKIAFGLSIAVAAIRCLSPEGRNT